MGIKNEVNGKHIFLVGIKGSGMVNLARFLHACGAVVSGCDTQEVFMTDCLIPDVPVFTGFAASLLPKTCDLVVHSAAWKPESCPILIEASRRNIPCKSYPQMLSFMSEQSECYAVAGTHGKTTTVGCASWLLSSPPYGGFPFFSIFGGAVKAAKMPEGGAYQGDSIGLLEACEYRNHFLSYRLHGVLVTSIEYDHPDFFSESKAVDETFVRFMENLLPNAFLIGCTDDPGVQKLMKKAQILRPDLLLIPYGQREKGPFGFTMKPGGFEYRIALAGDTVFTTQLPGSVLVGDIIGASILVACMLLNRSNPYIVLDSSAIIGDEIFATVVASLLELASSYQGCVGRLDCVAQESGILYIDDYAHHPTEIRVTLEAARLRYHGRRIVVLFSPHTASRTMAFFHDFVSALSLSDAVCVQSTYASARGDSTGVDPACNLAQALSERLGKFCVFAPTEEQAVETITQWLQEGDLCITMGAGNNRALGARIRVAHQA